MKITITAPRLIYVRMSPAHPLLHARDTRTEASITLCNRPLKENSEGLAETSADHTTICRQCLTALRGYRPGRLAIFEGKPDTKNYRSF